MPNTPTQHRRILIVAEEGPIFKKVSETINRHNRFVESTLNTMSRVNILQQKLVTRQRMCDDIHAAMSAAPSRNEHMWLVGDLADFQDLLTSDEYRKLKRDRGPLVITSFQIKGPTDADLERLGWEITETLLHFEQLL